MNTDPCQFDISRYVLNSTNQNRKEHSTSKNMKYPALPWQVRSFVRTRNRSVCWTISSRSAHSHWKSSAASVSELDPAFPFPAPLPEPVPEPVPWPSIERRPLSSEAPLHVFSVRVPDAGLVEFQPPFVDG